MGTRKNGAVLKLRSGVGVLLQRVGGDTLIMGTRGPLTFLPIPT